MIESTTLPAGLARLRRWAVVLLAAGALGACTATSARVPAPERIPADPSPKTSGVELADGATLPNLAAIKREIVEYHDDGTWERQVSAIADAARRRLDIERTRVSGRPALVLDIDDTALSTFPIQRHLGFGWITALWDRWVQTETAPAHPGILGLYRHAREGGVAVFFLTGRREHLRSATERQLRAAGYEEWQGLYLKPEAYTDRSIIPFKTGVRRSLEARGYEILVNVGDQWSDLEGGHARATYKLPNPMYYRP